MNNDLISIAMATYNGEKYLREQLTSIINQTYTNFELIICDDFSTDNTKNILQEYANKDSRIKLHFNITNLGFKKNFENTINYCTGQYIAFCDQDDIWEPDKLEIALEKIQNYDIYCSNALLVDENNCTLNTTMMDYLNIKYIPTSNLKISHHLIHHNICQGATMLCNADFVKQNLPIPNTFPFHDWYFALLASTQNGFFYDKSTTLLYRQHSNAVTGKKKSKNFKELLLMKSNLNTKDEYSKNISICEYILSTNYFTSEFYKYIKKCHRYYLKMSTNKDFATLLFFIRYYNDIIWDKNVIHKFLLILKRFLGIIRFKINMMRK